MNRHLLDEIKYIYKTKWVKTGHFTNNKLDIPKVQ